MFVSIPLIQKLILHILNVIVVQQTKRKIIKLIQFIERIKKDIRI